MRLALDVQWAIRMAHCCVLTNQSSRFLAHVSAASQPLNLNSPCLPGSKVALFSGFHLIHSGSQCQVTGRFANESFRQPSVRKRVGSIRKRPIVVSQTSYITLSAQG